MLKSVLFSKGKERPLDNGEMLVLPEDTYILESKHLVSFDELLSQRDTKQIKLVDFL
jgi:hypothetical protein